MMFAACPILQQWNHEAAFQNSWNALGDSLPAVLGGWVIALVACASEGVEVVVGVGFPEGEGQRDGAGSAREVLEETGYNLAGRINPEHYIEMTNNEQRVTLFIVPGISEKLEFATKTRKRIEWFNLADLPGWRWNKSQFNFGNRGAGSSEVEEERFAGGGGGGLTRGFEHELGPETPFGLLSTCSEILP
ncbi:hypothetical protein D9611_007607 [Ephemerocybe angulata]|uniref:Nudix hydrolase domain-containing protein n=1 Tax=Ephemerocybe angulata TaxID=980116 RepID=A0A8H5BYB3_9AGAR|nr:hypothetical protein D9611_007607 [Tulosesus angulatus]